jgi:hypothetical protein
LTVCGEWRGLWGVGWVGGWRTLNIKQHKKKASNEKEHMLAR